MTCLCMQRGGGSLAATHSQPRPSTGVSGHHYAPAALPSRKKQYPLYRRIGGHQSRAGRVRYISPSP